MEWLLLHKRMHKKEREMGKEEEEGRSPSHKLNIIEMKLFHQ
jgi:hypothetical protein